MRKFVEVLKTAAVRDRMAEDAPPHWIPPNSETAPSGNRS
jgi:hypothetical protein